MPINIFSISNLTGRFRITLLTVSWPILQHFSHTQSRMLCVQQNTHQICHKLLNMINIFGHKLLLRREKKSTYFSFKVWKSSSIKGGRYTSTWLPLWSFSSRQQGVLGTPWWSQRLRATETGLLDYLTASPTSSHVSDLNSWISCTRELNMTYNGFFTNRINVL